MQDFFYVQGRAKSFAAKAAPGPPAGQESTSFLLLVFSIHKRLNLFRILILYNKAIFDEYPDETWTWETYYEVAAGITEASGGSVYGAAMNTINDQDGWWNIVYAMGGGRFDAAMLAYFPRRFTSGRCEKTAVIGHEKGAKGERFPELTISVNMQLNLIALQMM